MSRDHRDRELHGELEQGPHPVAPRHHRFLYARAGAQHRK